MQDEQGGVPSFRHGRGGGSHVTGGQGAPPHVPQPFGTRRYASLPGIENLREILTNER